jgi:hypothetical protein
MQPDPALHLPEGKSIADSASLNAAHASVGTDENTRPPT